MAIKTVLWPKVAETITAVSCDNITYIYLGHIVNSKLKDDPDIMKQTRSLCASLTNFPVLQLGTKVMLFRTYCTQIYGCPLWTNMFQYSYNKLHVAYSDASRLWLRERRWGEHRNFLYLLM